MRFGAPGFLPLLAIPAGLLLLWFWQLWRRRADARAFMRRRQVPVERADPVFRRAAVLVLPDPRGRIGDPRAGQAASRHLAGAHRRRRHRHPAGRLGVDARHRRQGRSLAALDAVPAHARRSAALGERSRGDGAVRAHGDAADPPDQGSQHLFLLPRSPRGEIAVPSRRRRHLGHQHRARHLLGPAADREGRGAAARSPRRRRSCRKPTTPRRSCWSPTASRGAARSPSRWRSRRAAAFR